MFNEKPLHEIDDTATSAAEDRFEDILKRVKAAGAEILKDEETPLYAESGADQFEIGRRRIVEFNLNRTDFQITRDFKTARINGAGPRKSVLELPTPSITIKLMSKPELSQQWVGVDLEDMF